MTARSAGPADRDDCLVLEEAKSFQRDGTGKMRRKVPLKYCGKAIALDRRGQRKFCGCSGYSV